MRALNGRWKLETPTGMGHRMRIPNLGLDFNNMAHEKSPCN
jgi:hypothetical protein